MGLSSLVSIDSKKEESALLEYRVIMHGKRLLLVKSLFDVYRYINSIHSFKILVIIIDGYWGKSKEQEKTRQLTVNIFHFKRELLFVSMLSHYGFSTTLIHSSS